MFMKFLTRRALGVVFQGVFVNRLPFLFLSGCLVIVLFLTGCEDKEGDSIFLMIQPQQLTIYAETGTSILFRVNAESKIALTSLVIKELNEMNHATTLVDTVLNAYKLDYFFAYLVPNLPDSSSVILDFTITNNEPFSLSLRRRVMVVNESELLGETTGHVMHSALSGKPGAFNMDWLQPVFKEDHPDSLLHFADASVDSIHHNTLSRRWKSPAGYSFVKFQGFNYATATGRSLQNAYDAGLKQTTIESIQDDDVILIGLGDTARAAIYISQVIDADSTLNDRYIFSIKKRKQEQ